MEWFSNIPSSAMKSKVQSKVHNLTSKEIGEFRAREYYGEEQWKLWKFDYDRCMAFRKSIKGKPTDEQLIELKLNAEMIDWYGYVLYHCEMLAGVGNCDCNKCARARQIVIDPLAAWKSIISTLPISTVELDDEPVSCEEIVNDK